MNAIIERLKILLNDSNIKIEDFYLTERAEIREVPGEGGEEPDGDYQMNCPTGIVQLFYYVRYTRQDEKAEYERKRRY